MALNPVGLHLVTWGKYYPGSTHTTRAYRLVQYILIPPFIFVNEEPKIIWGRVNKDEDNKTGLPQTEGRCSPPHTTRQQDWLSNEPRRAVNIAPLILLINISWLGWLLFSGKQGMFQSFQSGKRTLKRRGRGGAKPKTLHSYKCLIVCQ